jgi:hypothetical protein
MVAAVTAMGLGKDSAKAMGRAKVMVKGKVKGWWGLAMEELRPRLCLAWSNELDKRRRRFRGCQRYEKTSHLGSCSQRPRAVDNWGWIRRAPAGWQM